MSIRSDRPIYHRLETEQDPSKDALPPVTSEATLLPKDLDTAPKAAGMPGLEVGDDDKVKNKFSGWKVGATAGAATSTAALIVNIAVLIWMRRQPFASGSSDREGQVEAYAGSCKTVKELNLLVHFGINALSSVLLSASNFNMRVLSAPTRRELDRAHEKGRYLDIGVQSLRNLSRISPWRMLLWWVLCLSSVPLHLLYNSAFYSSLSSRSYIAFAMTTDWLSYTASEGIPQNDYNDQGDFQAAAEHLQRLTRNPDALEYLEPADCLNRYAQMIVTDRSNLILVTNNERKASDNSSLLNHVWYYFDQAVTRSGSNYHPFEWYGIPPFHQELHPQSN